MRISILPVAFLFIVLLCLPLQSAAETSLERIYAPAPDEIIIYNADMAQVTEHFTIDGSDSFRVRLSSALLPNTLRVKVDGKDVPAFSLTITTPQGQAYSYNADYFNYNPYRGNTPQVDNYWLEWDNAKMDGSKVELTYLAHGISWSARYACDIIDARKVHFNYTASIDNRLLNIEDCRIRLLNGIVAGINQADWNNLNMTQRAEMFYNVGGEGGYESTPTQIKLNVHEIYDINERTLHPGKLTNITLFDGELSYTKHFIWDAREDREKAGKVKVIYKVMNESKLPFAAGTAQMYEDGIFIGMDPMELTPVGSPGHITMGENPDFRVFRYQKDERITQWPEGLPKWIDYMHTITLEVRYFGEEPVKLEITDDYGQYSVFYSMEGEKVVEKDRYDTVVKFEVDVKKGDKKTVEYVYYTD